MVGALVVDSGSAYFGRKTRKAAIVRQDRPDMQLAVLETPTACLVLGGKREKPLYNVLQKAEQHRVPVIITDIPVRDIAADLDEILLATPFHQEQKVAGLAELIDKSIDSSVVVQERQ
jgi:BioD-like phosphotransacetylase family protein